MSDVLDELALVLRDVFADDELQIQRDTTADDIEAWDSIANVNLFVAIEHAFGFTLTTAEMAQLSREGQTVGHLADLIEKKRGPAN